MFSKGFLLVSTNYFNFNSDESCGFCDKKSTVTQVVNRFE